MNDSHSEDSVICVCTCEKIERRETWKKEDEKEEKEEEEKERERIK